MADPWRAALCFMNSSPRTAIRSSHVVERESPGGPSPHTPRQNPITVCRFFLDQLVNTLRANGQPNLEIGTSAALHGHDLLRRGYTVSQVVHDYGDVCQTITELALETNAPIETGDFRTLNRCLDEEIAGAVTVYGRE